MAAPDASARATPLGVRLRAHGGVGGRLPVFADGGSTSWVAASRAPHSGFRGSTVPSCRKAIRGRRQIRALADAPAWARARTRTNSWVAGLRSSRDSALTLQRVYEACAPARGWR